MSMGPIVVIADNETYLKAIGSVLREKGLEPTLYRSAEAFIDSPPVCQPQCIVLDVVLSGMSGLDLQRRLNSLGSPIPVIITTSVDDPRIAAQARRLGCV